MRQSPEKMQSRMVSRSDGLKKSLTPIGALAREQDRQFQRPSVLHQADAVGIALGQADLVQQGIGAIGVIDRPHGAEFGVEQRTLRKNRIGRLHAQPQIDHLVDLAAVDGDRQRPAEAHIA
jgi:hypothetical protein